MAMPAARRMALLDWAGQNDCWIPEDDYDSEFNYERLPLPALKSLDEGDRVIHCGSFNKTLFAALRIGYAVLPRRLVPASRSCAGHGALEQRDRAAGPWPSSCAAGLARHPRRARAAYQQRRDRVLQCLREAVGEAALRVSGEQAGFHFVWWLPPASTRRPYWPPRGAHGLRFESLSALCHRVSLPPGVLVGFSAWQDEEEARLREMLRFAAPALRPALRLIPERDGRECTGARIRSAPPAGRWRP